MLLTQLWRPESDPSPWIPLSNSDARIGRRRGSGNHRLSSRARSPRSTSLFISANICMLGHFLHDPKKFIYIDGLGQVVLRSSRHQPFDLLMSGIGTDYDNRNIACHIARLYMDMDM